MPGTKRPAKPATTSAAKKASPSKAAAAGERTRATAGADSRARQPRGQARKDQIMAEAIEMLSTRGFRGTSIAELADRVSMTHPGLLYYFGTKERLLEEVVGQREASEQAGYLGHLGDDPSLFRLDEVARFVLDTAVLTRLYVVLAAENLDEGDPLHEFFVSRYERARDFVADVLKKDQARGEVRADVDLTQIGIEVIATLMGLEIQWLMDPEQIDLEGVVQRYVEGLRARLAP